MWIIELIIFGGFSVFALVIIFMAKAKGMVKWQDIKKPNSR